MDLYYFSFKLKVLLPTVSPNIVLLPFSSAIIKFVFPAFLNSVFNK